MTPEEEKLRLQQYQPEQPRVDISGGRQLQQAPDTFADQLAKLAVNMQQSPGGGTVTVNQPAPAGTPGYSYTGPQGQKIDIAPRQAGQAQPVGGPGPPGQRVPPQTTTAPVNTIDQNAEPDVNDPMAQLATSIGKALNQPVTLPTVPRKPAEAVADYQLEQRKATDQYYAGLQATDQAQQATRASQRVAQEFPGQNASAFPEGLSNTLEGGRKFTALPSGGYAITGGPTAASRAETTRRGELLDKLQGGGGYANFIGGVQAPSGRATAEGSHTTAQLEALARGPGGADTGQRLARDRAQLASLGRAPVGPALVPTGAGYRPAGRGGATDAMSNPAVLRAVIANNKYDPAVRRRAQQKLQQMRL
jgi:hypothetical protein